MIRKLLLVSVLCLSVFLTGAKNAPKVEKEKEMDITIEVQEAPKYSERTAVGVFIGCSISINTNCKTVTILVNDRRYKGGMVARCFLLSQDVILEGLNLQKLFDAVPVKIIYIKDKNGTLLAKKIHFDIKR